MPNIFDDEIVAEFLQDLEVHQKNLRVRVLVLGPNTSNSSLGSKLRKYIGDKCSSPSVKVYAERQQLIDTYEKVVGEYADLCAYEQKLAQTVEAIILIPDSAGSLVELGMFALEDEDIHRKTLVLFNSKYSSTDNNFVNLGPRKAFTVRGADVVDVSYNRKREVWEKVNQFINKRKAILFSKKRLEV